MVEQHNQVKSASRTLDILELFTSHRHPMTITEVASRLTMPLSSTHALLRTLLTRGYLIKNQVESYVLGPKIFELSKKYLDRLDVIEIVGSPMLHMREICGETISLGMLDGQDIILVHRSESLEVLRIGRALGTRLPLHASAMGKSLLATWPKAQVEDFFPSPHLERIAAKTITSRHQLMESLEEVRKTGVAYDLEESTEGASAVAAAIDDGTDKPTFSLAIVVPTVRAKGEHWARLVPLVKAGADVIGKAIRGLDTSALAQDFSALDKAYQARKV